MTTFGFEAEFVANAQGVLAGLHDLEMSGSRVLHSYHCDCDYCRFDNGYAFRGQTDSSCAGEIISDIFATSDSNYDNIEAIQALCDVAVDVDAEPGPSAGFHVHVGISGLTYETQRNALWQFVRWEPVLARIAGGRWSHQRVGMNTTVRDCLAGMFYDFASGMGMEASGFTSRAIARFEADDDLDIDYFRGSMLDRHRASDRHSNLNISSRRAPTWEFRLWNSTRVAWRMEMFCGLSVALLDRNVIDHLSELAPPLRRNNPSAGIDSVAIACDAGGHSRVAELLMEQATYLDDRADLAPAVLTAL